MKLLNTFLGTNRVIIFKSILTTFESSIIFKAVGVVVEIGLSLKP